MSEIAEVIRYLSWFILASSMFVAGLYLEPQDLRMALTRRRLLAKAVLANALIIPLIGLGLYSITPMPPAIGIAFLTVTFSFGVPLVLNFVRSFRPNIPFVTVLIFVLALSTSITMPIMLRLVLPVDFSALRTFLVALSFIVIFQLVPLMIGLGLGESQRVRRYVLRPLAALTSGAGIFLITLIVFIGLAGIPRIGVLPITSMVILTLSSLGIGWLFGGPQLIDRKVLAANSALRNFPIGLLLATSIFSSMSDAIGVALFAAIMILTVLVFSRFIARFAPKQVQPHSDLPSKTEQRQSPAQPEAGNS